MDDPGFEVREGVIARSACDTLRSILKGDYEGRRQAGARHLMSHPTVARFAQREDLLKIARRWTGSGAIPYRATLFAKSSRRNWLVVWHQDTALPLVSRNDSAEWGPWSTKQGLLYAHAPAWALSQIVALRVHLDDSTSENGPLRVIPGSHAAGVLSDPEACLAAKENTPLECVVGKGGILAMRPLLLHSSSKSRGPKERLVLHLEYAPSLELAAGIHLAVA